MAEVVKGRIYLPPTDPTDTSTRDVLHPETNIESVLVNTGSDDSTTKKLSEVLDNVVHVVNTSDNKKYCSMENCIVVERVSTV